MEKNDDNVIYHADGKTIEEFDEKYNAILVSYFNDAFISDIREVSKEMNLSEEDVAYIEKQYSNANGSASSKKKKIKWSVGDNCRAVYKDDLKIYEAIIEKIEKNYAIIRFVGYGNTQKVSLSMLMRSEGKEAVKQQIEDAQNSSHAISETQLKHEQNIVKQRLENIKNSSVSIKGNDSVNRQFKDIKDNSFTYSKGKKSWIVGDKCAAVFSEDNLVYEAKIEEINDSVATIKFFGYGDTQQVLLDSLLQSGGSEAIENQIINAEVENCTQSGGGNIEDWINGDFCLVYNPWKETFEEAIVCDISDHGLAVVATLGYNEKITVRVCELMESRGPHYRESQNQEYLTNIKKKLNAPVCEPSSSKCSGYIKIENIPTKNRTKFTPVQHKSTCAPPPLMPPPAVGLLQPNDEQEALACMMSSCYLSGYYAGYYTMMKKMNGS